MSSPAPPPGGLPPTAAQGDQPPGSPGPTKPAGRHRVRRSWGRELAALFVIAIVLALIIRAFFLQVFYIPSGSMERTLEIGDRVLVNKLIYDFEPIHRGDIVVFSSKGTPFVNDAPASAAPHNELQRVVSDVANFFGLGSPDNPDIIKRVIGIPGDRVSCCRDGNVVLNGVQLHESYIYQNDYLPFCAYGTGASLCPPGSPPVVVRPGHLWVMGDHRSDSADSRFNGQVPIKNVIGRAFMIIWPPSQWRFLGVPATFNHLARAASAPVRRAPALSLGAVGALPITLVRRRRILRRLARRRQPWPHRLLLRVRRLHRPAPGGPGSRLA